jgi:hypothetical protein
MYQSDTILHYRSQLVSCHKLLLHKQYRSSQIYGDKGSLVKVPNKSFELYLKIVFSMSM